MLPDDPWAPDNLIPLAELVIEGLAASVDELARRIGDDVLLDDIGRRCTTRATARHLIAERAAAAERLRARKAQSRRQEPDPVRERIRALQEAAKTIAPTPPPVNWREQQ